MDRDLRVPFVMSSQSIELIKFMLNRKVDSRPTIEDVSQHEWLEGLVALKKNRGESF